MYFVVRASRTTIALYAVLHALRRQAGIESSYCLCIGNRQELLTGNPGLLVIRSSGLQVVVEDQKNCRVIYPGKFIGIVSCGSIFGIGAANGQMRYRTLLEIVTAWFVTLPVSALLAAICWRILV